MKRFKNILLYAASGKNDSAISRAVELALENGARLTLMDVIKPLPKAIGIMTDVADTNELEQLVAEEHRHRLLQVAGEYSDTGLAMDVVVTVGKTHVEIVRQVIRGDHDLVIKTADGSATLFGNVALNLMRTCPCPVWVLKPELHGAFDRVLAAADLDADDSKHAALNQQILEIANAISIRENAELHIVCVWDVWMESSLRRRAGDQEVDRLIASHHDEVERRARQLLKRCDVDPSTTHLHLHRGIASRVIRLVAEKIEADLMVMGTVCRTGMAGFLIGNTAEQLIADATCSILALKPDGFETPITLTDDQAADEDPVDLPLV